MENQFQLITFKGGKDKKTKRTVTDTIIFTADNDNDAKKKASILVKDGTLYDVFPYITIENGNDDGGRKLMEFATRCYWGFWHWCIRNSRIAETLVNLHANMFEDLRQEAATGIWDIITSGEPYNMDDCYNNGMSYIRRAVQNSHTKNTREYNPDFSMCNVTPRKPKATCKLSAIAVRRALDTVSETFTASQAQILDMYCSGISFGDMAEILGKDKKTIHTNFYRIVYKIWVEMYNDISFVDIMNENRLIGDDIEEIIIIIRKKARLK